MSNGERQNAVGNRRDSAAHRAGPDASGARGFTLLEVLVALAILSVCLLAIYQGYGTTLAITTSTRKLATAIAYTAQELARWERMNPPPDVAVAQGTFPPGDPMVGYAWRREITDLEPLPSVIVRRVQIEVSWSQGLSQQSYRAALYVLPQ